MPKQPSAEELEVAGPAGRLEALFEQPQEETPRGVAVICHPHPQHGGTMQNKVVHMLARSFVAGGLAALRFNFRGVGRSEGRFADGEGEVDDVRAALAAARERSGGRQVWLAGFSFGAAMAVRAAVDEKIAGLVTVAPAAFRFAGSTDEQPRCPWLIVHGENDELVPIDESVDWVDSFDPGPELVVFPETGHFFHGRLVDLRDTVADFIGRHVAG